MSDLTPSEQRHSAGLMRVNHVGEVCAQALYSAQALFAQSEDVRQKLAHAAQEENDHLAWTEARLRELQAGPSLLNPLWYSGAFALGAVAARMGDGVSLGFLAETEKQVADHLQGHLEKLPAHDHKSVAIAAQMQSDEERHGAQAVALGAQALPEPMRHAMRLAAKTMTTVAYRI